MAIFLLHDEEMSNCLGVEHLDSPKLPQGGIHLPASLASLSGPGKGANLRELGWKNLANFTSPEPRSNFFTKNHESHSGFGKFGKKMLV